MRPAFITSGIAPGLANSFMFFKRIAVERNEVRVRAGRHDAQLALALDDLGVDRGRRSEHVDGLLYRGAELELAALHRVVLGTEQVRSQAQLHPRLGAVANALVSALERTTDLADACFAQAQLMGVLSQLMQHGERRHDERRA